MMTAESLEAELNIPPELKDVIEDSDDELPLRFNEPTELMEIFSVLEEKNLNLIERCQDSEQQLEEKKQQEKIIKAEFSRQIGILEANETTNLDRIKKVEIERDALKGISEDNESTKLDEKLQEQLYNEIYNVWKAAKYGRKGMEKEDDKSTMETYSPLSLVEETENILNKYFEEFNLLMNSKRLSAKFMRSAKELRKDKKKENIEQTLKMEEQIRKKIGEEKQREKAMKQIKKIGKPLMKREWAPPVQKVKEKVIKRNADEEAYFKYLGLELNEK